MNTATIVRYPHGLRSPGQPPAYQDRQHHQWRIRTAAIAQWEQVLNQVFAQRRKCDPGGYACYSAEQLVKEVFLDSDTSVAVVSAL